MNGPVQYENGLHFYNVQSHPFLTFSAPGDSGSLLYCSAGTRTRPLGIILYHYTGHGETVSAGISIRDLFRAFPSLSHCLDCCAINEPGDA